MWPVIGACLGLALAGPEPSERLVATQEVQCARPQWEMHAEKSTQRGYGVVAPQYAVAPNNVLRHSDDPAGTRALLVGTRPSLVCVVIFVFGYPGGS